MNTPRSASQARASISAWMRSAAAENWTSSAGADACEAPTIEAAVREALASTPTAVGQAAREFLEHLARELEREGPAP